MKSVETIRDSLLSQLALAALLLSQSVAAAPIISDNFIRLSLGESITAPFSSSAGAPTAGSYSNLVEIIVSGTGSSFGLNQNDAFYCSLASDERCPVLGGLLDSQYYQLNIGMAGLPFAGGEANNIDQFITFVDNVGPVPNGTLPTYDAEGHTYHFIVNLPISEPSTLSFGVSDGIYSDNDGNFQIHVFQVAAFPVPEPQSRLLIIVGLSLLFGLRLAKGAKVDLGQRGKVKGRSKGPGSIKNYDHEKQQL